MVGSAIGRVIARVVSSFALGACLILLARGTDPHSLGVFMTAYAIALIVGVAVGFGAPTRVLRAPAEVHGTAAALYRVHTGVVCVVLGAGAVGAMAYSVIAAAGVVFAWGDTVLNYAQAHLAAMGRDLAGNLLILAHRLVPLLVAALCLLTQGSVSFVVFGIASLVPVVLGVLVPRRRSERSIGVGRGAVFGPGWTGYLGFTGAAMISQLQVPVLGAAGGPAMTAPYALAARVTGPITLVTASLTQVLVPELARRRDEPERFRRIFRTIVLGCAIYLVVIVVLCWPAARVVTALAGPQYRDATVLVAACIVAAGLSANSQGLNVKLLALGRPHRATVPILVGNVVGLVVLYATGTTADLRSVAWAPIVTEVVVLALMSLAVTQTAPDPLSGGAGEERSNVQRMEGRASGVGRTDGHGIERVRDAVRRSGVVGAGVRGAHVDGGASRHRR